MKDLKITNKLETPAYLYQAQNTAQNIKTFQPLLDNSIQIFYAIKANNYKPMIQAYIEAGYGFDVASKEELEYALSLGADPKKISFSAPTKLEKDVQYASSVGVEYYAFDTEIELKKILRNTRNPKLIGRMTAKNKDATFNLSDKFGMSESYYTDILKKAKKNKWPIYGLTFHVGSQNKSVLSWRNALYDIERLVVTSKEYGINLKCINMGGGIPVRYENGVKSVEYYIDKIIKFTHYVKSRTGVSEFIIEPGRALSANTMVLAAKVVNIKSYKSPQIVVTDLSVFNGLIEPLEHFEYPVYKYCTTKECENSPKKYYKIVGISCDGYDIINKKCLLPINLKEGDYLIIPNAGAYSFVYENFHMRKFPKIIEL